MPIINLIFFVLSGISLVRTLTDNNTSRAYDHLYDTVLLFLCAVLIQPIY